jgi:hypothetical protein
VNGIASLAVLVLGVGLLAAGAGDAAAFSDVTAGPGSVAAGGDVRDNVINFGLTPEQVRDLTEAAARGATAPLTAMIVDLSKRLGVTEDATTTLLRIVGEENVPLERLSETLNRVANDYKRLQTQVAALTSDDPVVRQLVEQAKARPIRAIACRSNGQVHRPASPMRWRRSASGRAGRRGWSRLWRIVARHLRNGHATACRSTGR